MLTKKSSIKWGAKTPEARIVFYPRSDKKNAYFAVFSINNKAIAQRRHSPIEVNSWEEMNEALCHFINESDVIFTPF